MDDAGIDANPDTSSVMPAQLNGKVVNKAFFFQQALDLFAIIGININLQGIVLQQGISIRLSEDVQHGGVDIQDRTLRCGAVQPDWNTVK